MLREPEMLPAAGASRMESSSLRSQPHEFVWRDTGRVQAEELFCDRVITYLYDRVREHAPSVVRALASGRMTRLLGFFNYDLPLGARLSGARRLVERLGIDLEECVEPPEFYTTARRIFERRIRYEACRPMEPDPQAVVSPADARVLVGSLDAASHLWVKDKFFSLSELVGPAWARRFTGGQFAIFRLTPEKYHYNHVPVEGVVVDFYELEGAFHSCNPSAVVAMATPYSQNRRAVTIIDTDVPGGSCCGMVAMVEVAALMIGRIEQRYAPRGYQPYQPMAPDLWLRRGQPKSLFLPGSSVDVLVFEPGRVAFAEELLRHQLRADVRSRFSAWLGSPWVEVDVRVRSTIARAHKGARRRCMLKEGS